MPAQARDSQYGEGFPAFLKVALVALVVLLFSSGCCCCLWPGASLLEFVQWLTNTP